MIRAMTLYAYLRTQLDRDDPVGDFARDAIADARFPRRARRFTRVATYLRLCGACQAAIDACRQACEERDREAAR
jgi:uncharacterized protein YozE (UPF0346 family)